MNAMGRDPENRAAFERQRRTPGEKVFHPLGRPVSAMSEQPVIAHANAEASGNPPQEHGHEERLPREEKYGCDRADVKKGNRGCGAPIDAIFGCVFLAQIDLSVFGIHGWWLLRRRNCSVNYHHSRGPGSAL